MRRLQELYENGQSVWFDFIQRSLLENGELAQLVTDGVRGLTSNPTIFQKAIAGSTDYDGQIRSILNADGEVTTTDAFEQLAIADIRAAADLLGPVYEASNGTDGFVSLEVSPHLAYDTAGTIDEAHRLWDWVDRPNLMIKVPATSEGIPALEDLIASGINVNSTLLFSRSYYRDIAHAFVRGVERADDPTRIASVASFFVSRVDTKTDSLLDKHGSAEALALRGKIAVANAKLAYQDYLSIFEGETFAAARARGARPQRVLWASTSTKNPEYSDVLYVEPLIGPNTVNTMPPATIDAFEDHGTVDPTALTSDVAAAEKDFVDLADLGISIDEITDQLQVEGVAAFADSFDDLLVTLTDKLTTLR